MGKNPFQMTLFTHIDLSQNKYKFSPYINLSLNEKTNTVSSKGLSLYTAVYSVNYQFIV